MGPSANRACGQLAHQHGARPAASPAHAASFSGMVALQNFRPARSFRCGGIDDTLSRLESVHRTARTIRMIAATALSRPPSGAILGRQHESVHVASVAATGPGTPWPARDRESFFAAIGDAASAMSGYSCQILRRDRSYGRVRHRPAFLRLAIHRGQPSWIILSSAFRVSS